MKYYVTHLGGILKKQRCIIGHRYPMDFQLQNVQMHLMTSIMMKTIFTIKKVTGKLWKISAGRKIIIKIVKHHKMKYSSKMPLWVIVELMSFSNMSKLYSSMYYSEKDVIAHMVGVGRDTLENHLHCLSVLRNKCAHAARMYNTDFNPPAKFTTSFLRKHPEIKNNSLFAYTLVLLKRLPDEESKKSLVQIVETVIDEYRNDIDLELIGFPENYLEIMKNNL